MGAVSFGIPKKLVLLIRDHFSIKNFVETGTYKGKTSVWAAGKFENVYTIENSRQLFDQTSETLRNYKNISFLYGNSANQLKAILSEITHPAVFWLDAHWCGGSTYGNDDPCPLLSEISAIKGSALKHIIMIDDARFFLKPPASPQNSDLWPGIKEITELLNKDHDYFTFVSEDAIVSMPAEGKKMLQPYFNEVHKNEFPGGGVISNFRHAFRNIYRKWTN